MSEFVIRLEVISPERKLYCGMVSRVFLPGVAGPFEVLKDHAPLISALSRGSVAYTSEEGDGSIGIQSGFVEVGDNRVEVCAEV